MHVHESALEHQRLQKHMKIFMVTLMETCFPLHHLYSESFLHVFSFDFSNTKSIFLIYYYLVLNFLYILHAVS